MSHAREIRPHTPHTLTPLDKERDRGCEDGVRGVRTLVIGEGPQPWVTPEAMVTQALGDRVASPDDRLTAFEVWDRQRMLRRDTLAFLRERRRITANERRAGSEIAMVCEWQGGDRQPIVRSQFRERLAEDASSGGGSLWLSVLDVEHTRFAPWKEWARAFPVRGQVTLVELTLLMTVDGVGLRQLADRLAMDQRRALGLLRRSLHRYCVIAGWQHGDNPPVTETA